MKKINDIKEALLNANATLKIAKAAVWTRKYINDLPNAAFAVIEKGYKEGGNKNARHLPHHNANVKSPTEDSSVDLVHLRNAMARMNQIKSVLGSESSEALQKKAARHLQVHRDLLKSSSASFCGKEKEIWEQCEELFEKDIKPLLED